MSLERIREAIIKHPTNQWAEALGYVPVYTASKEARVLIVGQAPGKKAQESRIPWNDASGDTLRRWLGLSHEQFYDEQKIALVPMDFYYPGRARSGDLPLVHPSPLTIRWRANNPWFESEAVPRLQERVRKALS